jgi:hypothetical protein
MHRPYVHLANTGKKKRGLATIALIVAPLTFAGPSTLSAHAATSTTAPAKAPAPKASPVATTNALPVMNVTDVNTGKPFPLASVVNGKQPTLIWFWAPT